MSILTTWGYKLTDVDEIPGIMSLTEFDDRTANKYLSDSRVQATVRAAASAIREYCGWHVYPEQQCELVITLFSKRVTMVDGMILIQLPATFVSVVESVMIGDEAYHTYILEPNGILRVYGVTWTGIETWTPIVIRYTAGIPRGAADALLDLVTQRVSHALESSSGVQSETAGGVSVTYNASWANGAKATSLADDSKEALSPYRLRGVF